MMIKDKRYNGTSNHCEASGKKSKSNRKQALTYAAEVTKSKGIKMWPYKCDHCGNWHISKSREWSEL